MIAPSRLWQWIDFHLRFPYSIRRCWSMEQDLDDESDTPHIDPDRSSTARSDTIILPSPVRIPPRVATRKRHDKFGFTYNSSPLMELPRSYGSASSEAEGRRERTGAWCFWPTNQTEIHQGHFS
ncbi:hypothetical protein PENSTE_c023G04986 [Penicillium steckii]|uniref:Uncharacterized protein n=1 Tax=Penicillium steckii TaxID=303698 RepID=A0A1V6SSZ8_9EURO|nr:hypothetical protein PENSTE_c023G04986 [Penicillium steckii]